MTELKQPTAATQSELPQSDAGRLAFMLEHAMNPDRCMRDEDPAGETAHAEAAESYLDRWARGQYPKIISMDN